MNPPGRHAWAATPWARHHASNEPVVRDAVTKRRPRIARDLHDHVAHSIGIIAISAESAVGAAR
ncbi:MAG TPA: histidine kinase [Trebonia sp.]|nr:histidine kinase [Trebonia sp.]